MVISNISLTKDKEFVTLSADIAFRNKTPQHAYFKVLRNYETFVVDDATPFLAAFLVPCMKTRENIYVDDSVSALLLENTNEIMSLLKKTTKNLYKIRIRSKRTTKNISKSDNIGTFFEADIDTFYTYLKENSKKNPITHFLYAHGFNDYLQNKDYSQDKEIVINKIAKEQKVSAIFVETNIGSLIDERLHWNFVYPGAMESIALFLDKDFKKISVAETNENNQLFYKNDLTSFDTLWSTEAMIIQQEKNTLSYAEKIKKVISKSPLALKYLYVCRQKTKNSLNCGHCYGCLVTMIFLYNVKSLKKAKTFENTIDMELIKKMHINYTKKENILVEQALASLKKENMNSKLQTAILYSLEKNRRPNLVIRVYQAITTITMSVHKTQDSFTFSTTENFLYKLFFKKEAVKKA